MRAPGAHRSKRAARPAPRIPPAATRHPTCARAQVCENSGSSGDSTRQTVLLSGVFLGGVQVFAIVNLRTESAKNVGMRLTVRSTDMQISQFVAASVA